MQNMNQPNQGGGNVPPEAQGYFDAALAIPSDIVELPTGGKMYPNGQNTVTVEVLIGMDEELISYNRVERNPHEFYIDLLERKVKDLAFPVENLYMIDVHKILFHILANSYGNIIEYQMDDPHMKGAEVNVELNIGEDFEEDFPDHVQWDENYNAVIELPNTKHKVTVELPTLGKLSMAKEAYNRQPPSGNRRSINHMIMTSSIKSIDMGGKKESDRGMIDMVLSRLPLGDFKHLMREFDKIQPTIRCNKGLVSNAQGENGQPLKFFRELTFDPIFFFLY